MKNLLSYFMLVVLLTSCTEVIYVDKRLDTPAITACEGVTPHQLIQGAMPEYPKELRSSSIEGFVILKLDVNKKGQAENITVAASSPSGYFDSYAINAAKKWKYKPASQNNELLTTRNIYTSARFCIVDYDPVCIDPKGQIEKVMSTISRQKMVCEK
jgi:TonB family protein